MDQPQQQQQPSSAFRSRPKTNAEELVAGLQPTRTAPPHLNPGVTAASHLELIGRELLKSDAPLLWNDTTLQDAWTSKLMALATQACSTVDPNVKRNGDFLDIRPYCKLKVIPGGSLKECAYLSGVVFRKTVAHKHMAHVVEHPRIFLMSGGIEFTRNEHRIASLETLLEQEDKYTEILVGKIIKAQPTVLLVGKSVSRKAQELLLKHKIVLCQHVKTNLMQRIARQTGATILNSLDHVGLTEACLGQMS
jgi:1-phosphatidylinositol-3-phosphate 5-kinase